jgi:lipopolysaccharide export system protein LptA
MGAGLAALAALALTVAGEPAAQGLDLSSGGNDRPIEVTADNGIEWQRGNEVLVARGNAKAVRGETTVHGDVLRAYYRKKPGGGTDLIWLDAEGKVVITSTDQKITGNRAAYNMQKAILVVRGKLVRFTSGKDQLTATRQLEYWEHRRMAVARGDATALHDGKRVRADVLVALLRKSKKGKMAVYKVVAHDNVTVTTDQDRVRADKGIYNVDSGIATLTGRVVITRGESRFAGDKAVINLNTGISRLLTDPKVGSGPRKRIRAILKPKRGGKPARKPKKPK